MLSKEQKELIEQINNYKEGVSYYEEELRKHPDDDYVQCQFKIRKENCIINIESLRKQLKETLH